MNLRLSAANIKNAASQTFRKSVRKIFLALLAFAPLALFVPTPGNAFFADVTPLCKSAVAISAPTDTSEDILAICPIPANALASNGILRITLRTLTNNANVKTGRARLTGVAGTDYLGVALASQVTVMSIGVISNRGANNSQIGTFLSIGGGLALLGTATSTVDTTAITTLVITCQKATGTDTCTLESYLVELVGGGT